MDCVHDERMDGKLNNVARKILSFTGLTPFLFGFLAKNSGRNETWALQTESNGSRGHTFDGIQVCDCTMVALIYRLVVVNRPATLRPAERPTIERGGVTDMCTHSPEYTHTIVERWMWSADPHICVYPFFVCCYTKFLSD